MWKSAYVGVYQLLNWKMHGETLKQYNIFIHKNKFVLTWTTILSHAEICQSCLVRPPPLSLSLCSEAKEKCCIWFPLTKTRRLWTLKHTGAFRLWNTNIQSSRVSRQLLLLFATNHCISWQLHTLPWFQHTFFPRTITTHSQFPQHSMQICSENRTQIQLVTSVEREELMKPSKVAATNLLPISMMDLAYGTPIQLCRRNKKLFLNQPSKAQWSLYVPPVNIHNSTFCPHSVFMCFVWIKKKPSFSYTTLTDWFL